MPKRTLASNGAIAVRVVVVTLDNHLASAVDGARLRLRRDLPGLELSVHAASEWHERPEALDACRADIARGDIVVANMLFMEEHIEAVRDALAARRDHCDAMVCCMSGPPIVQLTRMGSFDMSASDSGGLALLKKLRPKSTKAGEGNKAPNGAGAKHMAMLRRLPQILRFLPGTAQDVRAYFLTLQYWLLGSEANLVSLVRLLVNRYAAGERAPLQGSCKAAAPVQYPDVGLYHPDLRHSVTEKLEDLPGFRRDCTQRVGLIIMRSYVLAGNTDHYDAVIRALEARGLSPVPAFASGLDSREAVEAYFVQDGKPRVSAVLSLTGFSLVGGPAYNDSRAAEALLSSLDVPYLSAQALEFQTLEQWQSSERGLLPLETTMMVAIPELDGAAGTMIYGGRSGAHGADERRMSAHPERAERLAERVQRLLRLRQRPRAERRLGIVLFNFPPNAGAVGTAAYLAVFESLYNTLHELYRAGYSVDLPESVEALRSAVIEGNAARYGMPANVLDSLSADDYVREVEGLEEIEAAWGPAPGRIQSDGRSIFILGARFGNVTVGVQPGFGYEGDPMRLLFERGFAPTHAFAAFYHYLGRCCDVDAVLHFGTHGALEFMPGKQTGLSGDCWPERLIGALPNFYLYAANNPSEGIIAKRRSQAVTLTYLTPPVSEAGVYGELAELKDSLTRWRGLPADSGEAESLLALLRAQAEQLQLLEGTEHELDWDRPVAAVQELTERLRDIEETLIPYGMHVIGEVPSAEQRGDLLRVFAESRGAPLTAEDCRRLAELAEGALQSGLGKLRDRNGELIDLELQQDLCHLQRHLAAENELGAIIHALDGGYVAPVMGGDLVRSAEVLPTGRNLHGFDPMRLPSAFATREGARQAACLLDRYPQGLPGAVAMVLWGTDNLKNEGVSIGQALALLGARPRMDGYGRLAGADLIPLEELGRPRIDVVLTLSGIFRDLLPKQIQLLAEAAYKAATADEPLEQNFVRRNALRVQQGLGCSLEDAALRVFSNAAGTYGANVNQLVDSGLWQEEDELGEMFIGRKCFAYGMDAQPRQQAELMKALLESVDVTYQNLDSVELGVTSIDHYFDSLGGISRAVQLARGDGVPTLVGDHSRGDGVVRTLADQLALETRTRILNPKWYEEMLSHGYEGVHQIESHVTNTMGWSATTGQVAPWVYDDITRTFVLDEKMRNRLAELNPLASVKLANRLMEAHERRYWSPDAQVLEALQRAGDALEDRLEGVTEGAAA